MVKKKNEAEFRNIVVSDSLFVHVHGGKRFWTGQDGAAEYYYVPLRSLDIPRCSLDAPRRSLDVPRYALDVPRCSLDVSAMLPWTC